MPHKINNMSQDLLKKPLFILGNPRSGTSLFRIILNSHPNIVIPPESGFTQWWFKKYSNFNVQNLNNLDPFLDDLLNSKKIETYELKRSKLKEYIISQKPQDYQELCALVYLFYGSGKDVHIWGDKNNYYIHHIPLLLDLYPNSKQIHLMRDGRDVACSYLEVSKNIDPNSTYFPDFPSTIEEIANAWCRNVAKIMEGLSGTNHLTITYEELITNFKPTLLKVTEYLECDWSDSLLTYYNCNDEPTVTAKWKQKTFKPIDSRGIGRYKKELTKEQISVFNEIAGSLLQNLGYII